MFLYLARKLKDHVSKRTPNALIGGNGTRYGCYMARWWVIPRNKCFNIYLHHFQHSDEDRALHDHPWANISYLIEGQYVEVVQHKDIADVVRTNDKYQYIIRKAGQFAFRLPKQAHRIKLFMDADPDAFFEKEQACWTLFITGPVVRKWGFICPQGWKLHTDFTKGGNVYNDQGVVVAYDNTRSVGCGEP